MFYDFRKGIGDGFVAVIQVYKAHKDGEKRRTNHMSLLARSSTLRYSVGEASNRLASSVAQWTVARGIIITVIVEIFICTKKISRIRVSDQCCNQYD